jgi:hypothetical protein
MEVCDLKTILKTLIEQAAAQFNRKYEDMLNGMKSENYGKQAYDSGQNLSLSVHYGLQKPIYLLTKNITDSLNAVDSNVAIKYLQKYNDEDVFWVECPHDKEIRAFCLVIRKQIDGWTRILLNILLKNESDFSISMAVEESSISEIVEHHFNGDRQTVRQIEFALKVITYLLSGEPDLRFWDNKVPDNLPKRDKDRWKTANQDKPDFPAYLVGVNWMKDRIRHVDSSSVSAHFRWQPCGTARSLVKLIWIDEHERVYNKH